MKSNVLVISIFSLFFVLLVFGFVVAQDSKTIIIDKLNSTKAICGNGICEPREATNCPKCPEGQICPTHCIAGTCPKDCNETDLSQPVCGNGICEEGEADLHPACLDSVPACKVPERKGTCPEDCNKASDPKIKILPEVASQRARERLGDLGFNITLKEVGVPIQGDKVSPTKFIYYAVAEKQGKLFGIFKVKASVSADIDAETGTVSNIKKPWWAFLAGI